MKLAGLYEQKGKYDKVIDYDNLLLEMIGNDLQKRGQIEMSLLDAYLNKGDAEKVTQVVAKRLAEMDLGTGNALIARIEAYLNSSVSAETKAVLVQFLADIKVEAQRPQWARQIELWRKDIDAVN
jgi:hypothetical protein